MKATASVGRISFFSRKIRDDRRYRRVVITTSASVCAKGVSAITALTVIAAAMRHLGTERYGLYATVTSLSALLAFADLGVGNGLVTAIAQAEAAKSFQYVKKLVSSAFLLLVSVSIVLCVAFLLVYSHIPWNAVFNVRSSLAGSEAALSAVAFVICFLILQPLSVVQKVYMGFQEGYVNEGWTAASSLFTLVGVLFAIKMGFGTPGLLLAVGIAPIIALTASNMVLFGYQKPWIRPDLKSVDRTVVDQILRSGILFLVLQVAAALAYVSDHLVIAQLMGPEAVADYSIPSRLFGMVQLLIAMGLSPMWPAYGEALAIGDHGWVKRTFMRTLKMALLLSGLASIGLLIFGSSVVELIGGSDIRPSAGLMVALAVWTILASTGNCVAVLLNGANVIRIQVILASMMAIAALGAKIWLVPKMGVSGAVWGTIIAYALFSVLPCCIYLPRFLRRICRESH